MLAVFLAVLLGGCTRAPKEPDRLFLIKEKGRYGYIDRTGRVVIPPQYVAADNFSEGLAGVRLSEEKYGYIDTSGKMVISPQFEIAGDFFEGLAKVALARKEWGAYMVLVSSIAPARLSCHLILTMGSSLAGWPKFGKTPLPPATKEQATLITPGNSSGL